VSEPPPATASAAHPVSRPQAGPDAGEDLQILSYFHFALAAMIAMAALVPALFLAVDKALADPAAAEVVRTEGARATGTAAVVLVGVVLLAGFALAVVVGAGARELHRRGRWSLAVRASALQCLFFPLGTLLGGVTLARLFDPAVRATFRSR
jgi:hypothetical protein